MNYEETIEFLFNQLPVFQNIGGSAYKEGLGNSLILDEYLDYPHKKYKTIHVGGTNGKGSTSHTLAAVLAEAGYKVGLYTSPHLVDFRERIRINGTKIPKEYVVDFVARHQKFFAPIHPSFFELTMSMAFRYFADEKVDIAVIEVGLGGRLDSTNIISPDLSIITNISLDHIQFLGNSEEKIAAEKAGIIKPNTPVVIGEAEGEVRKVFEEKAKEQSAPIVFAEDQNIITSYERDETGFILNTPNYPQLSFELGGLAQLKNAATILTAINQLIKIGYHIPDNAVYSGFAEVCELTGLMGRWQVIQESPRVICDTGHNVGGISYIAEQLKSEKYDNLHFILGMVNDKDISTVLSLLPKDAVYYFTKASIARALDENELKNLAEKYDLKGLAYSSVEKSITSALGEAKENDLIFIGGSNFTVGEALPHLISEL